MKKRKAKGKTVENSSIRRGPDLKETKQQQRQSVFNCDVYRKNCPADESNQIRSDLFLLSDHIQNAPLHCFQGS